MSEAAKSLLSDQGGFPVQDMHISYQQFAPQLYNWCKSIGFTPGKMMPSRAFCSDESQGYPVLLLTKHFGTFPFNHGYVGAVVATDLNGPHADHGEDMILIQASHVGYDPVSRSFGDYRRLQTHGQSCRHNCGKIFLTIDWYMEKYQFARNHIWLHTHNDKACVIIDKELLIDPHAEGLHLKLEKLADHDQGILEESSTTITYAAPHDLIESIGKDRFDDEDSLLIGDALSAELFDFKRQLSEQTEGPDHLEKNLFPYMSQVVTHHFPALLAAEINTQMEFERVRLNLATSLAYQGKRLLFISGLNIDVSPQGEQLFPQSQFVPWAAYIRQPDGSETLLDQTQLSGILKAQDINNAEAIDLEAAMGLVSTAEVLEIEL